MWIEAIFTLCLGVLAFAWGQRFGRLLLRKGATANNLFKGKTSVSLAFLGLYIGLLLLALYVPQFQVLPLQWRVYGMRVTWTLMRIILMGFCGLAFVVSWRTARTQVVAVALLGILGLGSFTGAESYFLAPIYSQLKDNLLANGIFQQTSSSSCAPSALANVLRIWGIAATESNVARLAETSRLGTSMPQLIMAAHEFGMDGIELRPTWEQMQQINRPGVLATWLYTGSSKAPHAIALIGMSKDAVIIGDSALGQIYQLAQAEFEQIWRGEYVPIFPTTALPLPISAVINHLQRSGYLEPQSNPAAATLKTAIQNFQKAMGIRATGEINAKTALLLSGPFLSHVPTLREGFEKMGGDKEG